MRAVVLGVGTGVFIEGECSDCFSCEMRAARSDLEWSVLARCAALLGADLALAALLGRVVLTAGLRKPARYQFSSWLPRLVHEGALFSSMSETPSR